VDGGCEDEFGDGGFVDADCFGNLELCGTGRDGRVVARMDG